MASPVEHLAFAARGHQGAHVHLGRYIVTANASRVAVFDTATLTPRAFDLSIVSMQTAGEVNVFSWSGRLFVVGYGAGSLWYLIEIHLGDGTADVFTTGIGHGGSVSVVATVVGTRVWFSGPSRLAWMDLSTMAAGTVVATAGGFVAGATAYQGTSRWDAATGAALGSGSGVAPDLGASKVVTVAGVVHRVVGTAIWRWDTATEASLANISSATLGPLHQHTDGWLWSVSASSIRAFNPATLAIRDDAFPTVRAERVAVVTVGSDLWAPSGHPI